MGPTKHPIFTQHSRSWRDNLYVYPVVSRRSKGVSIGVNLNPDKACNFDCVYCCVDRSVPAAVRRVDLAILANELEHMLPWVSSGEIFQAAPFDTTPLLLRRLNDIAFSGDGEPTSCPVFPQACELAAELLAKHRLPDVKIIPITNATLLHRPAVAKALQYLAAHNGEIWAKLDAGTQEYYQLIERTRIPLDRVIQNIAAAGRKRPIVIQSLFMNIRAAPPPPSEVAAYIQRLRDLHGNGCQIKLVQVYTVARQVAETYVTALSDTELDQIAEQVRTLGLTAEAFYAAR